MATDNKHMKFDVQNYKIFVPCESKHIKQTLTSVTNGHVAASQYMWNIEY